MIASKYALTITSKNIYLQLNAQNIVIPLADVVVATSHKAIEGHRSTDYIQISSKTSTVEIPYLLENEKIVAVIKQAKQGITG